MDTPRLRTLAVVGLWTVFTRSLLFDIGWGTTLALWCALFLGFVGRSQKAWLGFPHTHWWSVASRADVAMCLAALSPERWGAPLFVFVLAFKGLKHTPRWYDGGILWKAAPLLLLLRPRHAYLVDVVGVAMTVGWRHAPPANIHTQDEYHTQFERCTAADALGLWVLVCAGAPWTTRAALAVGTILLALGVHLRHPRKDVGDWDTANSRQPHMPVTFRHPHHA
jgi:hypothetical protein